MCEALELLQRSDFDLIISDVQMDEMRGLELLRKIQNTKPLSIPFANTP